ncbi:hypothetical protein B0O80DRAFT_499372 [Mortierella sp. GBAus27b]|nr:hypothetical protein B0O80DRAFT_499372 [Mortierella sp. GBAus27b]
MTPSGIRYHAKPSMTDVPKAKKFFTDDPPPADEHGNVGGLPPIKSSREELMHTRARDLVQALDDRHIDHTGVVEKPELVDIIMAKCTH